MAEECWPFVKYISESVVAKILRKIKGITSSMQQTQLSLFFDVYLEKCCWEMQSYVQSFDHPLGHIKNGSWAWNTFLPRDRELTQPVPSFLPCMGMAFLVSDSLCSLLCSAFKHMCQWSSDRPPAPSVSGSTGWSPSATALEVCIQTQCPMLAGERGRREDPLATGLGTHCVS